MKVRENKKFEPNDIVRLAPEGSPEMIVLNYKIEYFAALALIRHEEREPEETDMVTCQWFAEVKGKGKLPKTQNFREDTLIFVRKF
jgi:uncharacterized protein YodC (DUF2158 family)